VRIAFNFHGVGVGNNGGTRTVLKSAMMLAQMGQEVQIWSDGPSQFDWFVPEGVDYIEGRLEDMEPVDALIATGQSSARSTAAFAGKKVGAYWVRGFETWSASVEELAETYSLGLRVMANSSRLIRKIKEVSGVEASMVRPGLEVDFFTRTCVPGHKLGALYSPKSMKRACDVAKVFETVKRISGASTVLMSAYDVPEGFPADEIVMNPSEDEKRDMYRSVGVWYAPTDNDGLHIPPMEAGLCGAALVAHGVSEAGMEDYAIPGDTALTYPTGDLETASLQACRLLSDENLRSYMSRSLGNLLIEEIGSRRDNMARMVEVLS